MNLKNQLIGNRMSMYSLNYQDVLQVTEKLQIKVPLIDWEDSSMMKGKTRLYKGRIFVHLIPNKPFQMLIIDKNHQTRFLVEKIQTWREVNQAFSYPFQFYGIKIESNKYFARGKIQAFQMTSFQIHIGFDIIDKRLDELELLLEANVDELQDRKIVLFCKEYTKNTKTYFDKQKNILKIIKEQSEQLDEHQYFGTLLSNQQLVPLLQNQAISTMVVSYFFKRLIFSYNSSKWFCKNTSKNIVAFSSQDLTSYFACQSPKLKGSFFDEQIVSNYCLISQNPFKQLKTFLFPIYEHNCYHFVLAALHIDDRQSAINVYELDPLNGKEGAWRKKLAGLLQDIRAIYQAKQCASFFQNIQIILQNSLEQLKFPEQESFNDCGIYICTYAILLLHKLGEIQVHQSASQIISQVKGRQGFFSFLRYFIHQSYITKDAYLFDSFNHNFYKQYQKYMSSSNIRSD